MGNQADLEKRQKEEGPPQQPDPDPKPPSSISQHSAPPIPPDSLWNGKYDRNNCTRLGSGGFGNVLGTRNVHTNKPVALKFTNVANDESVVGALKEARILQTLKHDNIVAFLEAFLDLDDGIVIVMETCNEGNLTKYLRDQPSAFSLVAARLEAMIQISTGLKYLHDDARLGHRDVKPDNILVQSTPALVYKIADLGTAKSTLQETSTMTGTDRYKAPEVGEFDNSNKHSIPYVPALADVFSLALTFVAISHRQDLTETDWGVEKTGGKLLKYSKRQFDAHVEALLGDDVKDLRELILLMTSIEPRDRPIVAFVRLRLKNIAFRGRPQPSSVVAPSGYTWFGGTEETSRLGGPSQRRVYKMRDEKSRKVIAMKIEQFDTLASVSSSFSAAHNQGLVKLKHLNLVKLHADPFLPKEKEGEFSICIPFEYADHGNLNHFLEYLRARKQPVLPKIKIHYLKQLVAGLHFLHDNGLIYRNLMPSNILVFSSSSADGDGAPVIDSDPKDAIIKLSDLFCVRDISKSFNGSAEFFFMAPEVYSAGRYSFAADVFSLALVFLFILTGDSKFDETPEMKEKLPCNAVEHDFMRESFFAIVRYLFRCQTLAFTMAPRVHNLVFNSKTLSDAGHGQLAEIVVQMLAQNPDYRLTLVDVLAELDKFQD